MRTDLFHDKKSVHVKLPKDIHLKLREKLIRHNLTMQDVIMECIEMILAEDRRGGGAIIDRVVEKKIAGELRKVRAMQQVGELDSDMLYSLLEKDAAKPGDDDGNF